MVVVRAGIEPTLYVNGVAVAESQIGERIVNNRTQAQIIAWYGVRLKPGVNRVEVRGKDSFQNERVLAKADIKRPSAGVKLAIKSSSAVLKADGGESFTPVTVTVLDANNFPASGVYYITLDVDHGTIAETDLQPDKPGVQVRVENGSITVPLKSSTHVGRVSFSAETGTLKEIVSLQQTAPPRPLLVTGLVNIEQSFRDSEDMALEQALQQQMDSDLKARIALFMKGKIKNDVQLTLAYDSEKNNDTLLRDVNPNEYYPTYGDASVRGFEAQSRSKLYLKLEKNLSSITWGDYLTDAESTQLDLARVQRTLTGVNVVHASDTGRLQVFAANVSDARVTEEIRGNGTAMLYQIAGAPIVRNSDVVERIVRAADNIGVVIRTERLLRFSDYTIDPISGLLRFSDTVPSVDSEQNPVFIRISYDRRSDFSEHVIAGVRVQQRYGENNLLESSLTADQNPLSGYLLAGTSWQHDLGRNTTLKLSAAMQHHNESGRAVGRAARVQMEHHWGGRLTHRSLLSWARATRHFTNPGSGLTAGREEWRAEHQQPLTRNVQLTAQATGSRAPGAEDGYTNASVKFNRNFGSWNLQWGAKTVRQYNESSKVNFNTVLLGAEKRFQFGRSARGTIGFDVERDASDAGRYSASVFSRLRVHKNAELYARYQRERQISLGTAASNNDAASRLTVGVESDVLPKTHVFSEYRLRGNDSGRSLETASGVRGRYELKPKLDISPTLEVVDALEGDQAQDSVAVSVGLSDRRNPNRQLSAHAEARKTEAMRYFGARATMAQRLSPDWTALVREDYTRQAPSVGQLTSKHQLSVGMARRPKRDNRHHLLLLADWKEDYGPEDGMDRRTYMLSTHQNRQLSRSVSVSGRVGTKLQRIRYEDGDVHTNATLADARFMFDIRRRWEADLRFGWIGTRGAQDQRYSLGVGLAWLAERNLRLGIAYNFMGFRDEDLDADGENARGVKLGVQMKFDEDWFRWLEQ